MQKRIFIATIFLSFLSLESFAQSTDSLGNTFYLELAGKGFASGNFDFTIGPNSRLTLGLTLLDHEFAKENEMDDEYPTQTLPTPSVMYFLLAGKNGHFMEAGFGCSISPVFWKPYSPNDSWLSLHGSFGYRYQRPEKVFFRAGFTPFYRVNWAFLPLVGVSIGYSM